MRVAVEWPLFRTAGPGGNDRARPASATCLRMAFVSYALSAITVMPASIYASAPSRLRGVLFVPASARRVTVRANRRRVDHARLQAVRRIAVIIPIVPIRNVLYPLANSKPGPVLAPAVAACRIGSIPLRRVTPGRAGANDKENAVHHLPVRLSFRPLPTRRQHLLQDSPLRIRHIMPLANPGTFPHSIQPGEHAQQHVPTGWQVTRYMGTGPDP